MIPSQLSVTGFDKQSIYFRTVDAQDVFVNWTDLPIREALASETVQATAEELTQIRSQAIRDGLAAIERALAVVTDETSRQQLTEAYDSLQTWSA